MDHVARQCNESGVDFHFKQWGEWSPWGPVDAPSCVILRDGRTCDGTHEAMLALDREKSLQGQNALIVRRVGVKAAGRELYHQD